MYNYSEHHHAITTLAGRFFRSLDERRIDDEWARRFLTEKVRFVTPIGATEGAADAARLFADALARFDRTQHVAADVLVDVEPDGERATASWNALMMHVKPDSTLFTVGGRYETELVRTPQGWRFDQVSAEQIWTTGEPPA
ncbi:nuclear transport factor 2 family protein [Streptomyces sp. NPDC049577]|uniref:nuclear transport factor 2 family protein n=1 Tax=Streptomyces sp. NPDC049577 TaxID=3155153 RepID=UPI0034193FC7